jgi:hypothetical protein
LSDAPGPCSPPGTAPADVTLVDGADPQRLGGARRLVPSKGGHGRPRAPRTGRRPAGVGRQSHQKWPARLGAARRTSLCSTRRVSIRSAASDLAMPCAARPNSTRPWSCAAASLWRVWMRSWRSSARAGTPRWLATSPTRPPLRFPTVGYADPLMIRRLGRARLTRFCARHSRGAWGEARANELLRAAVEMLVLWVGDLAYPDLAEDIGATSPDSYRSAQPTRSTPPPPTSTEGARRGERRPTR